MLNSIDEVKLKFFRADQLWISNPRRLEAALLLILLAMIAHRAILE